MDGSAASYDTHHVLGSETGNGAYQPFLVNIVTEEWCLIRKSFSHVLHHMERLYTGRTTSVRTLRLKLSPRSPKFAWTRCLCRMQKPMRELTYWYSEVFGIANYESEL